MSTSEVVSVELPVPVPVGGQSLMAATIMLIADPEDIDSEIWFGKVRWFVQRTDRLDVTFFNGEVATVKVSEAYVSFLQEADPDEAFALMMRGAE